MSLIRIIIHLIINMAAVGITGLLLPGVAFADLLSLFLGTIVLGLINTFIKPIVQILTLPLNILTLGIVGLIINALLVLLASLLVTGFIVASFWWAVAFVILLALVSWFLHLLE